MTERQTDRQTQSENRKMFVKIKEPDLFTRLILFLRLFAEPATDNLSLQQHRVWRHVITFISGYLLNHAQCNTQPNRNLKGWIQTKLFYSVKTKNTTSVSNIPSPVCWCGLTVAGRPDSAALNILWGLTGLSGCFMLISIYLELQYNNLYCKQIAGWQPVHFSSCLLPPPVWRLELGGHSEA